MLRGGLGVLRIDIQHPPPIGDTGLHIFERLVQIGITLLGAALEEAVAQIVFGLAHQRHVLALGGHLLVEIDRLA